jgi:CDP-paratose 2-epimerase
MKKNKKVLITGSAGLIGSESSKFFANLGFEVHGIDNNMRQYFFGEEASTEWSKKQLKKNLKDKYFHYQVDIRDNKELEKIFKKNAFDLIIHTAAQPSHDWAAKEPVTDFTINALGTLYMLENYRKYSPDAVFIFTSTNKVYGDTPNELPLIEKEKRFELPKNHKYYNGIDESMSIDNSKHSIFGASKVAADVMVQEYGKYFNLSTGVFRGGCLTGPAHSGAKLHGFLSYLVKCIATGEPYSILGYKGKQVRDNIHSFDLVTAFYEYYKHPKKGEVYNMGGARFANVSMLEAIEKVESLTGKKGKVTYKKINRIGDHIWYISDTSKFKKDFPNWKQTYDIDRTIDEICRLSHFS